LFFDDTSPLPKISSFDTWYESSAKNGSSVEILRQMLELAEDLAALPPEERRTPEVRPADAWTSPAGTAAGNASAEAFAAAFRQAAADGLAGAWDGSGLPRPSKDVILRYGPEASRPLYLSQAKGAFTPKALQGPSWDIHFSYAINKIPTAEESDRVNGRISRFTGKGMVEDHIDYAGFKDVVRQVAVVVRNESRAPVQVRLTATLHDTYHDNGTATREKALPAGGQALFVFAAPPLKWIRRLEIGSRDGQATMRLQQLAFVLTPRNALAGASGGP